MNLEDAFARAAGLQISGRLAEAEAAYRELVAVAPEREEVHYNLGLVRLARGELPAAVEAFERALALRPDLAEAAHNLGLACSRNGDWDRAEDALRRAVELQPGAAASWNGLGVVLKDQGRLDEALACLDRAVALAPDHAGFHSNRVFAQQYAIGQTGPSLLAAARGWAERHAVATKVRGGGEGDAARTKSDSAEAGARPAEGEGDAAAKGESAPGGACPATSEGDRAVNARLTKDGGAAGAAGRLTGESLEGAAAAAAKVGGATASGCVPSFTGRARDPERRLRVGYVSPNFRTHCQALFLLPLFEHHDHDRLEIFGYSDGAVPDAVTARLQEKSDGWRVIAGRSDAAVAELINADRIDVLVDLTLHMAGNRLAVFARRPAPVQVTWLGYPGTTGLDAVHWRLTDPWLDPPGAHDAWYAEKSWRLPETFWCYDPLAPGPDVGARPLAGAGVVFGCLNNFCKVNDATLRLWAPVLQALPDSRLLLLAPPGRARQGVAEKLGIDPRRVEFAEYRPRPDYLELYRRIDLCLDTFPYNGHTTSLDAFWMGVPVVSLAGDTAVARAGLSMASNLGLPALVATTPGEFALIALDLARDEPRRRELRAGLRARMERSPLMDARRFARNIEDAYRGMWREWCARGR